VQLALYMRTRVIMQEFDIDAQQRAHRNSMYCVEEFKKNVDLECALLIG
jgi:hypothetical protein